MAECKCSLRKKIDEYSFVLDDLRLFLDMHPECPEALDMYDRYVLRRDEAIDEFENDHGPLCWYELSSTSYWQWVNEPWPWEGEY